MSRMPGVLVSTPLQASEEEDHACDGKSTADKIDLRDDFFPGQATGIWSRWGEVEEQGAEETNCRPDTAEKSAIAPSSVAGDQLSPQDGWTERHDGED